MSQTMWILEKMLCSFPTFFSKFSRNLPQIVSKESWCQWKIYSPSNFTISFLTKEIGRYSIYYENIVVKLVYVRRFSLVIF